MTIAEYYTGIPLVWIDDLIPDMLQSSARWVAAACSLNYEHRCYTSNATAYIQLLQ